MSVDEFKIRQGNTQFSIVSTLEDSDHNVVDLTAADFVNFRMSPIGGGDTVVDAVANVVGNPTDGVVQYDWEPGDTDTPGFFLGSWRVVWSAPDDYQDFPNGGYILVNITPNVEAVYQGYITPEMLKKALTLTGTTFADGEIGPAITSASDALDEICGRKFRQDKAAEQTRYYRPVSPEKIIIHDLVSLTSLECDQDSDGNFEQSYTLDADFYLWPYDANLEGRPFTAIELNPRSIWGFPSHYPRSAKVVGHFGWPELPSFLGVATNMLAAKLIKRMREAPFGIVAVGLDVGSAVRIARNDPDICMMTDPYVRERVVV